MGGEMEVAVAAEEAAGHRVTIGVEAGRRVPLSRWHQGQDPVGFEL